MGGCGAVRCATALWWLGRDQITYIIKLHLNFHDGKSNGLYFQVFYFIIRALLVQDVQ